MIVLNDLHLGVKRQGGTTPASQDALRSYVFNELRQLLQGYDQHYVLNGDIFDGFTVEEADFLEAFDIFKDAILCGNFITFIMGNHDYSAKGDRVSSFHTLAYVLESAYERSFRMIDFKDGFCSVEGGVYAISHQLNQDLFEVEVKKALKHDFEGRDNPVLLLHCNIMSPFAEHSDHSLNLNEKQVDALVDKGWTIVCGHEHQKRVLKNGKVLIPGNQIPTSIADNLNCDAKYYVEISNDVELIRHKGLNYVEVDWRDESFKDAQFIRVVGSATSEEASEVVDAVNKIRKISSAFIVSNAVSINGMGEFDNLVQASFEDLKKVDVLGLMLEEFDERESKVIRGLLDD